MLLTTTEEVEALPEVKGKEEAKFTTLAPASTKIFRSGQEGSLVFLSSKSRFDSE
jgi:hypothetical protein